jgi:hypothetical protein
MRGRRIAQAIAKKFSDRNASTTPRPVRTATAPSRWTQVLRLLQQDAPTLRQLA